MLASIGYESLFEMLAAGRFDAFPRGLNEVGSEMKEQLPRYPGLTLEKTKAIYFPFPVYFWVSKQNTPLARRVLQGLKLAERDGSFKALFLRHHAEAIQLLATMAGKPRRSPIPNCRPAMPNRIPAGGGSGAEQVSGTPPAIHQNRPVRAFLTFGGIWKGRKLHRLLIAHGERGTPIDRARGDGIAGLDITHTQRNKIAADPLCNIGHLPLIGIASIAGVRAIANWRTFVENLQAQPSSRTFPSR
jgi:hypothetical protein